MSASKSVLIIGKPASGKTTFLAQFLTRVTKGKSKVK
jgi:KaiC/GvpD/RAD55 family RecA-like ATPase